MARWISLITIAGFTMLMLGWGVERIGSPAAALAADPRKPLAPEAQVKQLDDQVKKLEADVKRLEDLVPDQAAVMSRVGYHFANLNAAIQQENWPLADYYLTQTHGNIDWAVRTRPTRKDTSGHDVDLGAMARTMEGAQLNDLKQAISSRQKAKADQAYQQALAACYTCHKAVGKPYLRPQVPAAPDAAIINFDPHATQP